ncbi:MAG: ATP-binding protein [Oscillospiraceae bacterium]|nr:ATP-binding protein [Oscillospiraceae bacterium]
MLELSLNILDVAQNSIKAQSTLIELDVEINSEQDRLVVLINDDGFGMSSEQLEKVTDPFFTTRDTRSVGLGVPFFKDAAESTGGEFKIESAPGKGTSVRAVFGLSHIDRVPLGDMNATVEMLVFFNTGIDFVYRYRVDDEEFALDTREIKELLEGAPIDSPEVKIFISEFLKENTTEINKGRIF